MVTILSRPRQRGQVRAPAFVMLDELLLAKLAVVESRFDERGYGLWAVERREDGVFLGFTGLAYQTFEAPFTPCVEVGWRYDKFAWGHGYATEAGRARNRRVEITILEN